MPKKTALAMGQEVSDKTLVQKARRFGAKGARVISPQEVLTGRWVRWKCRFGCDGFGSSLCCPPHSPTPEETRGVLDEYSRAILFEAGRSEPTKIAAALERELFLEGHYKAFGMGAGPCRLCDTCSPEEGCRNAEEARPSMEACGVDVYATVRRQGFQIQVVRESADPQHYFGLVLVD
jgi:predicted metal-binding protein